MKLIRRNGNGASASEQELVPAEPELIRRPPSSFFEQYVTMSKAELIVMLTQYGLGRKEICEQLGVSITWFDNLVSRDPEIQAAIFAARRQADVAVVNALFRRAVGYNYMETTIDKDGREVKRHYKHQPPDVTACIFWLKNRMKDEWSDSSNVNLTLRDRMELGNRQISSENR